ncbi:MAG: hypothetical protein K1X81_09225 [Bacteroidia bacterium]|nr:hypothetical protein [Bacteroidia bacterium]
MIDRNKLLEQREKVANTLREKATKIEAIQFDNHVKVSINLSLLPKFEKDWRKNISPELKEIVAERKGAVYVFHLPNITKEEIEKRLQEYKDEIKDKPSLRRTIPSLKDIQKRLKDADVLYIGSTNEDFGSRFYQHLGYGSATTGALQLIHWARTFGQIEISYYIIEPLELALSLQAEIILCKVYKPLIGKMATDMVKVKRNNQNKKS